MQTQNTSAADAIQRACAEISRMREEPVEAAELSEAQQYLTGSFALGLDSNSEIANFISHIEFFELGLDYADRYAARINAVTADDLQRVARKYLRPAEMYLVVVGGEQVSLPAGAPCAPAKDATP